MWWRDWNESASKIRCIWCNIYTIYIQCSCKFTPSFRCEYNETFIQQPFGSHLHFCRADYFIAWKYMQKTWCFGIFGAQIGNTFFCIKRTIKTEDSTFARKAKEEWYRKTVYKENTTGHYCMNNNNNNNSNSNNKCMHYIKIYSKKTGM